MYFSTTPVSLSSFATFIFVVHILNFHFIYLCFCILHVVISFIV